MQKRSDQQTDTESRRALVEQVNHCLDGADYARALDLLRGAAAEFGDDPKLSELEKLAQTGVKRHAEANRLITESQGLFAQQKPAEAIQLLREAYALDKKNSLARAILANALVEHAQSIVESDWLEAEKLTNQALGLNTAHPTAKTILNRIVEQKENSSVEDWLLQARKLHSCGDLFGALAWVAEGLAVHPHDAKLLQMQDAIQRDQDARRRQTRRADLEDLRRLQREIHGAADVAAKEALAERIQAVAAKYWTDGEILSIANALLLRLGLVAQDSSGASQRSKGATVILHVPRPSGPKAPSGEPGNDGPSHVPSSPVPASPVSPSPTLPRNIPAGVPQSKIPPRTVAPVQVKSAIASQEKVTAPPPEPQRAAPLAAQVAASEFSAPAVKAPAQSSKLEGRTNSKSNAAGLILVFSAVATVLIAGTFFFTRRHYAALVVQSPAIAPGVSAPAATSPASAPSVSTPAPAVSAVAAITPEPSLSASAFPSDSSAGKFTPDDQPSARPERNPGTLVVVTGQDDARVFLNGKLERQLTRGGRLQVRNLELKDYVVRVAKSGFQDPPQQRIRIRGGEEARLIFNLQPQPRLASLSIEGGTPGATVLLDQSVIGTIPSNGTLSVSSVNAGEHVVELRKDRFKPRQLKEHFVAGGTIYLAAANAALEAAPSELKIIFTPADAKVALVKGELLTTVTSGVPVNLAAGTYTLSARTADRFTRWSTIEVVAGQSKTLDLSLAPSGMSKWDDPGAWKSERDSFIHKGGDFVLYGVVPASGTFAFAAMPVKGHLLQWVLNYIDSRNYVLFQMDENNFYRTVIRNGQKTDEITVPTKVDRKTFRTLRVRVGSTEIVNQIKQGDSWTVLDRWTQPGTNLTLGKFGFYLPGNDEVALSSFDYFADLNIR